jgi:hypothetical protein
MPKLIIHSEITTPDGDHEHVIAAIHKFEQMPSEQRLALCAGALELGEILPSAIGGLIAIGVCVAIGKNTVISKN